MASRGIRRCSKILNARWSSAFARPPLVQAPALAASAPERATLLWRKNSNSISPRLSQLGVPCYATNTRYFSSQPLVDPPSGDLVDVPLAQTGEGIAECELLRWFVEEGDYIEEFQPLCEVQSDKATIEITSRFKGKVSKVLYGPGDIVKVGETMLKILVNEIVSSSTSDEDCNEVSSDLSLFESLPESTSNNQQIIGGALATPSVRQLAKQYGININDISGSGNDGRVLKEDVLDYAVTKGMHKELPLVSPAFSKEVDAFQERETKPMAVAQQGNYGDKVLPLRHDLNCLIDSFKRGFQRSMVKSMTMAAKVPHFYYLEEINCNALLELKATFQKVNTEPDVKHTFLPFLIKSLSMALSKYPLMNSSFHEESNEVILKGCHNIGVAMATPNGLVVPNIRKVQSRSIMEVTKELARLQQLAVGNKLSTEDITGGTITLSNIGSIGGKFGSPILNLPEVAIIAIGRIQKLPRFSEDGKVYPACVTNVTVGADHRIVDGATVARFCNEWKLLIENPELLLLHMR